MKLVNLTEHIICLRGKAGELHIPPSGRVARVSQTPITICKEEIDNVPVNIIQYVEKKVFTYNLKGDKDIVNDLPKSEEGTWFIVSSIVQDVIEREDAICPDTGATSSKGADGKPLYIQRFRSKSRNK